MFVPIIFFLFEVIQEPQTQDEMAIYLVYFPLLVFEYSKYLSGQF